MVLEAPLVAADVVQWLYSDAAELNDTLEIISELAERIRAGNIPLDRAATGIWIVHPNVQAEGTRWSSDGTRQLHRYVPGPESDADYASSPIKTVHDTGRSVRVKIGMIGEDEEPYPVIRDLRGQDFTDYLALPMLFSDGSIKVATFATKAPGGFTNAHVGVFEAVIRPLALVCELKTLRRTAETVLNTYVGPRAGSRVLEGTTRRGQGETIKAIISFADIRGFTRLSNSVPADMVVMLLNKYFGAMTEAVEAQGGEVLKFIGDEIMAIFPYESDDEARDAAHRALLSASQTLEKIREINQLKTCIATPDMSVAISLHAGDVFYGNVGSENRLDFTVVGPAVNLGSRIAGLAKKLNRQVLVSDAIADIMGCRSGLFGQYQVNGFDDPVSVYSPDLVAGDKLGYCPEAAPEAATARDLEPN